MKKGQHNMKTQNRFDSIVNIGRLALAGSLALAALLRPGVAAAQDDKSSGSPNITPGEDKSSGSLKLAPGPDKSTWSFNFTPVLLMPDGDYRLGGGVDPEAKYTLDRGGVRLSAGLRIGGFYAKNLFGI